MENAGGRGAHVVPADGAPAARGRGQTPPHPTSAASWAQVGPPGTGAGAPAGGSYRATETLTRGAVIVQLLLLTGRRASKGAPAGGAPSRSPGKVLHLAGE